VTGPVRPIESNADLPHEGWANLYDHVVERTFGSRYDAFTRTTLAEIRRVAPPPARVIDFGAGTGRLSLPLAAAGYAVTAVDAAPAMLAVLADKAGKAKVGGLSCEASSVERYRARSAHDVGLCVFTVVGYLLDEEALKDAAGAMAGALAPGGRLLLDIPGRVVFEGFDVVADDVIRCVEITEVEDGPKGLFDYRERTVVRTKRGERRFDDAFRVRWWPREVLLGAFADAGLELEEDRSHRFAAWGAEYLWLRRVR